MDIITLALAKSYTDTSLAGGGAIKGKNCVVDSITAITGGHRVTFKWTLDNGTEETGYMDVMDGEKGDQGNKGDTGLGIASVSVNSNNHLIITYEDSSTEDAGQIVVTTATFGGMLDVEFTDLADGQIAKYNAETQKWENAEDGGGSASWVDVTGTLTAGQTSITLNDSSILESSTFDFYTSKFGVNPIDVELTVHKIKALRQELVTQESELDVSVTANSSWSGYEAWKAFLLSGGAWIGDGGNPHWLQVEFDSIISIREMDFVSIDSSRSHPISRIGYSNDGVNFNECGILNSTMINDVGHCELDNDYEAKYFRIYFDGDYGLSSYPCMSQLEIYGYDEDPQRQKSITLTFEAQSENLNVKVRVS